MCTGPSQAASVAAAVLNPTYFKKSRRDVEEDDKAPPFPKNSSVGISSTNSLFLSASTIELFPSSSSTLFQYFLFDDILYININLNNFFLVSSFLCHKFQVILKDNLKPKTLNLF